MIIELKKAYSIALTLAASLAMIAPLQAGASDSDSDFSPFVIGGEPVTDDADVPPWLANVRVLHPSGARSRAICAATLIGNQWAITAAHCLLQPSRIVGPDSLQLVFDQRDVSDSSGVKIGVKQWFVPRTYSDTDTRFENDIALLQLDTSLTDRAQIELETQDLGVYENDGTPMALFGWGQTSSPLSEDEDGSNSVLQRLDDFPIVSRDRCQIAWGSSVSILTTMLCAGATEEESFEEVGDACIGDSGGPLFRDPDSENAVQAGIVSFGTTGCGVTSSGRRIPSVYTNLQSFGDWLTSTQQSPPSLQPLGLAFSDTGNLPLETRNCELVRLDYDFEERAETDNIIFSPRVFIISENRTNIFRRQRVFLDGIEITRDSLRVEFFIPRDFSDTDDLLIELADNHGAVDQLSIPIQVMGSVCDERTASSGSGSGGGGGALSWPWAVLLLLGLTDWLRRRRVNRHACGAPGRRR